MLTPYTANKSDSLGVYLLLKPVQCRCIMQGPPPASSERKTDLNSFKLVNSSHMSENQLPYGAALPDTGCCFSKNIILQAKFAPKLRCGFLYSKVIFPKFLHLKEKNTSWSSKQCDY